MFVIDSNNILLFFITVSINTTHLHARVPCKKVTE